MTMSFYLMLFPIYNGKGSWVDYTVDRLESRLFRGPDRRLLDRLLGVLVD